MDTETSVEAPHMVGDPAAIKTDDNKVQEADTSQAMGDSREIASHCVDNKSSGNEKIGTTISPSLEPTPQIPIEKNQEKALGDEEAPESEEVRLERLGRARPSKFKTVWAEVAFCYSIVASVFMAVSPPCRASS